MRRSIRSGIPRPGRWTIAFMAALACTAGAAAQHVSHAAGASAADAAVTILSESFESWPPPGWVLTADPQTGGVWDSLDHPAGCASGSSSSYSNNTGGSGLCADANSDCLGDGMDTTMVTPSFSLASPAYVSSQLQFKSDFYCAAALDEGWVDITTDGGAIWTNLLYFDHQSIRGPDTQTIDLTPYLGQPDVRLAFEYTAPGWDWYWQVDDVVVSASETVTAPPPVVTLMKKAAPPFRIVVTGSNLQKGMAVTIDGAPWASVAWKSTGKIVLKGAIKTAVPKGAVKTFRFENPDGGVALMSWSW